MPIITTSSKNEFHLPSVHDTDDPTTPAAVISVELRKVAPLLLPNRTKLISTSKETSEAATIGYQVGYDSTSQFSREYMRMFGRPPISDIKQLRHALLLNT